MDAVSCLLLVVTSAVPPTPPPAAVPLPTPTVAFRAADAGLHAPSPLPWEDVLRVRSFDPNLGVLAAVRVRVDAYAHADVRVENMADAPCWVHAQSLVLMSLGSASGTPFAHLPFESEVVWVPGAFDGVVDFAGESGRRRLAGARRHAQIWIDDPALLAEFLDADGVVELPVSAYGSSVILGGDGLVEYAAMEAGVRIEVEYLVAEPEGS